MEYTDRRDVRKLLWNSVDARFHRRALCVCLVMACMIGVISAILWSFDVHTLQILWLAIIGLCMITPLLKLLCIFRKSGHYQFFRTTLSGPHTQKGNHRMLYFPVTIQTPEFGTLHRRTAAIFDIRKRLAPLLAEYLDKEVIIAWNAKTDMVVVIGR